MFQARLFFLALVFFSMLFGCNNSNSNRSQNSDAAYLEQPLPAPEDIGKYFNRESNQSSQLSNSANTHTIADANFNGDDEISLEDFLILSDNYTKTNALHSEGDANRDGVVNFLDFLILSEHMGKDVSQEDSMSDSNQQPGDINDTTATTQETNPAKVANSTSGFHGKC